MVPWFRKRFFNYPIRYQASIKWLTLIHNKSSGMVTQKSDDPEEVASNVTKVSSDAWYVDVLSFLKRYPNLSLACIYTTSDMPPLS